MLDRKSRIFDQTVTEQEIRQRREFLGWGWLGNTTREVSYRGIDKINTQRKRMMSSLPNLLHGRQGRPLEACTGKFRGQWGLPCAHELLAKHHTNEPLTKDDIHPFWWL